MKIKPLKIGITGPPGSGKTTAILKLVEMLQEDGIRVGGMITREIRENGIRVGFLVEDVITGEKEVFAHINFRRSSKYSVGKYGVDVDALDRVGVKAIYRAIQESDAVVIDEIGRMETFSQEFSKAVKEALAKDDLAVIMTLHKKSRDVLLQEIRKRPDVQIFEISTITRSLIPRKVHDLLIN